MKKFKKVILAVFILFIVLSITTYVITPKTKVMNTPTTGKTSQIHSPIKNIDGSFTYKNVNSEVFDSMKQKLAKAGVQVHQGNEGDIIGYGAKIHFKWEKESNLTITIKDKPWYVSNETIEGKITEFVHNCGGS
jgi:hypothetical protein